MHTARRKLQYDKAARHSSQSDRRTKCPFCSLELLKKSLPRHIRSAHHVKDAQKSCIQCGITFERKDTLDRHQREQHGDASERLKCDLCKSLVSRRWFKEHRYGGKCKNIRGSALRFSAMRAGRLNTQPGVISMTDPLVIAASFHRSAMLAYLAWEPLLQLDYFTDKTTDSHRQPCVIGGDMCNGPIFTGQLLHSDSELPLFSPELWQLRYLALARTREMVRIARERSSLATSTQSLDESIIGVSLLNAADWFIFGKGSNEHQTHACGLRSLLKVSKPTSAFASRFESVVYHTWREVSSTFWQRFNLPTCTDVGSCTRAMIKDISRRLTTRLIHELPEVDGSSNSSTPGLLILTSRARHLKSRTSSFQTAVKLPHGCDDRLRTHCQ